MRNQLLYIIVVSLILITALFSTQAASLKRAEVTYVAAEGIYLNAGRLSGLSVGDTLTLKRGDVTVGTIVITNISSSSCAAEILEQQLTVAIGDVANLSQDQQVESIVEQIEETKLFPERLTSKSQPQKRSRLSGSLSLGQRWSKDLSGSDLSFVQPYLRTKLIFRDLFGEGVNLNLKHRVRLSHRSSSIHRSEANSWSNQVYELSLTTTRRRDDSEAKWGIGRVLVSEVRGMGYLDGMYYISPVAKHFRAGVALGAVPDRQTSDVQFNRRKLGFIGEYRSNRDGLSKLRASIAFSGEYEKDVLSREFVYLQTRYTSGQRFSWTQSAEIDYNRSWRYEKRGRRLEISNYYTTANLSIGSVSSINFSWDARKNIVTYESRSLADSLFDDQYHQGLRIGLRTRPNKRVTLSANGSLRLREGAAGNNKSLSVMARLSQFPSKRQAMTVRLSTLKTEFTTAYRPSVSFRWPISRTIYLNTSMTTFIYKVGDRTTRNYYIDANTSFLFGRRYSFYGGLRQYLDDQLKSLELFTEVSLRMGE